ncbi:MAG: FAD-dependent oxidoreductase [Steroidobacteraceae bacterium]
MAERSGIPVWQEVGATPAPAAGESRLPLLIVGAGPVGLTLALDLARKGHRVVVLNRLDFIAAGSKGICYAKRTLDIWNRLGVGETMLGKGVVWNVGKVFWGADPAPIYQFDMLPVKDQQMPGFINLQQYYVEQFLVAALASLPNVDIRWGHELVAMSQDDDGVVADIECAGQRYRLRTDWLLACDGHRSRVRELMQLDFEGRIFEDNFLIADIKMHGERPSERWFWFDPPFNPGQSALLHKQPDDVWRLDFQLGWNIDREACTRPERVEPLVRGMLGSQVQFTREWYSVYTFQCRRMARFVHGRVLFVGDSAHLVSPFGARGANGGIADVDNLAWKLDLILRGGAAALLLESYNYEATVTADENIRNSTRSTDFLTPKSAASRSLRDAVLGLARDYEFARPWVNSGRLSTAVSYPLSALNTPDEAGASWQGVAPGSPALDAPWDGEWLLGKLGERFVLLTNGWRGELPPGIARLDIADAAGDAQLIGDRYDLSPGSASLIRPDQYVAARWRKPDTKRIARAWQTATGGRCE